MLQEAEALTGRQASAFDVHRQACSCLECQRGNLMGQAGISSWGAAKCGWVPHVNYPSIIGRNLWTKLILMQESQHSNAFPDHSWGMLSRDVFQLKRSAGT